MKKIEEYAALITGDSEKQKIWSDIIFSGIATFTYIVFLIVTACGERFYNFISATPNTDTQLFYWIKIVFYAGTIVRITRVLLLDVILLIKDCVKEWKGLRCVFV